MKICRMTGSTSRAVRPSTPLSTGTSRQPSSRCPSSAMIASSRSWHQRRSAAVARQEDACRRHSRPARGSSKPVRPLGGEKLVRHLRQNAGAVAGQRIAAAGPAMRQIDQDFQARAQRSVALFAADVDDEADAAGIVLVGRIVQALLVGRTAQFAERCAIALIGRDRCKTAGSLACCDFRVRRCVAAACPLLPFARLALVGRATLRSGRLRRCADDAVPCGHRPMRVRRRALRRWPRHARWPALRRRSHSP